MMLVTARLSRFTQFVRNHKFVIVLLMAIFGVLVYGFGFAQEFGDTTAALTGAESGSAAAVAGDLAISSAMLPFNILFAAIAFIYSIIAFLLGNLITLILYILINTVLGYNGFGDSFIVGIGWPLVRDLVNMFVIVILLVIAVKTMLGIGGGVQQAQQNLVRLFLAVIAVNFSKTIALLMIDAGQVLMFTFVNAMREVASGNFVNLLQLGKFMSIDLLFSGESPLSGFNGVGYMATAMAQVLMLSVTLGVVAILGIVFLYRIVILWILIILSPIGFFLMGIQSIVPKAGSMAGEWWNQLVAAVLIGPILTFFLWLGLAAASNGSIAGNENFNTGSEGAVTSLLADIFQVDQLLSWGIGMLIILIGFRVAAGSAQQLGGIAAKLVNEQTGSRLMRAGALLPATALAKGVERRTGIGRDLGKELARSGGQLAGRGTIAGLAAGGALTAAGGYLTRTAEPVHDAVTKSAQERLKTASSAEKAAILRGATTGTLADQEAKKQLMFQMATDKDAEMSMREELKNQGMNDTQIDSFITDQKSAVVNMSAAEVRDMVGEDASKKQKYFKAQAKNLHLLKRPQKDAAGKPILDADNKPVLEQDPDAIRKVVQDDDFKATMLSKDAVKDPAVQKELNEKVLRTYQDFKTGKTVTVTALDDIVSGKNGAELRDAVRSSAQFSKSPSAVIEHAVQEKVLKVENLKKDDYTKDGVVNAARLSEIAKGTGKGNITGDDKMPDLSLASNDVKADLKAQFQKEAAALEPTDPDIQAYRAAEFAVSDVASDPVKTVLNYDATGDSPDANKQALERLIKQQPKQMAKVTDYVKPNESTRFTKDIASTVKKETAEDLEKDYRTAKAQLAAAQSTGDAGKEAMARQSMTDIEGSIANIHTALVAEVGAAGTNVPRPLKEKYDAFRMMARVVKPSSGGGNAAGAAAAAAGLGAAAAGIAGAAASGGGAGSGGGTPPSGGPVGGGGGGTPSGSPGGGGAGGGGATVAAQPSPRTVVMGGRGITPDLADVPTEPGKQDSPQKKLATIQQKQVQREQARAQRVAQKRTGTESDENLAEATVTDRFTTDQKQSVARAVRGADRGRTDVDINAPKVERTTKVGPGTGTAAAAGKFDKPGGSTSGGGGSTPPPVASPSSSTPSASPSSGTTPPSPASTPRGTAVSSGEFERGRDTLAELNDAMVERDADFDESTASVEDLNQMKDRWNKFRDNAQTYKGTDQDLGGSVDIVSEHANTKIKEIDEEIKRRNTTGGSGGTPPRKPPGGGGNGGGTPPSSAPGGGGRRIPPAGPSGGGGKRMPRTGNGATGSASKKTTQSSVPNEYVQRIRAETEREVDEALKSGNTRAVQARVDAVRRALESLAASGEKIDRKSEGYKYQQEQFEKIRTAAKARGLNIDVPELPDDPYDVLGVASDASPEEVKKAYRTAVKQTHPDRGGDVSQFGKVQDAFKEIDEEIKRRRI